MCKDLYREICQFAGTDYVVSWLIIGKMASLTVILKQKIIRVHCCYHLQRVATYNHTLRMRIVRILKTSRIHEFYKC